jgi:hypothetical protein
MKAHTPKPWRVETRYRVVIEYEAPEQEGIIRRICRHADQPAYRALQIGSGIGGPAHSPCWSIEGTNRTAVERFAAFVCKTVVEGNGTICRPPPETF